MRDREPLPLPLSFFSPVFWSASPLDCSSCVCRSHPPFRCIPSRAIPLPSSSSSLFIPLMLGGCKDEEAVSSFTVLFKRSESRESMWNEETGSSSWQAYLMFLRIAKAWRNFFRAHFVIIQIERRIQAFFSNFNWNIRNMSEKSMYKMLFLILAPSLSGENRNSIESIRILHEYLCIGKFMWFEWVSWIH